uniref:Uncharacterized protein n=1 Tax=Anguilla anguilla TaxID=7936 RepID=A0A0E9TJW2_ANGAN
MGTTVPAFSWPCLWATRSTTLTERPSPS